MSAWLEQALARGQMVNDWLTPCRVGSMALLQQSQWPNRKTEHWKYTSVRALEKKQFDSNKESAEINIAPISGLDAIELVFVNGQLQNLPTELPAGLSISALDKVDNATQDWVRDCFSTAKPKNHLFGLVNDVLADNGVIIDVAAGAEVTTPIRIVNVLSADAEVQHRVLVRLGEKAKLTVIEQANGNQESLLSQVSEYFVSEHAELEYYRLAFRTEAAMAIGGTHIQMASHAKLDAHLVGFGSQLSRLDLDVLHRGEHTHAKINAIYLLHDKEHFDLHSNIEHEIGHCVTDETVRGIVGGEATAVFNGRIHIHRDAQKTLAELNNKNLLLTDTAKINTKPELEIYADDVRCAHGATVAELDQSALYYMTSRGISRAQALVMLNFGFINALVDEMPNADLAQWLRPQLQQRFSQMNQESMA